MKNEVEPLVATHPPSLGTGWREGSKRCGSSSRGLAAGTSHVTSQAGLCSKSRSMFQGQCGIVTSRFGNVHNIKSNDTNSNFNNNKKE